VEWDDEEDFEPPPLPSHGTAPKLSAAKAAKARDAEAARRNLAIEDALQEGETENDRARRLQQVIEDADAELAADLYAGSGGGEEKVKIVASLEGYALKNLKDHVALAYDVADRMEKVNSKANFQSKLVRELLKKIEDKLTIEDCEEIIGSLSAVKAAKEKTKKQPTAKKAAKKASGKTKKDLKAEQAQHADLFGGFVENEYESYEQEYDDFI